MRARLAPAPVLVLLTAAAASPQETIGPWTIVAVPITATELVHGGPIWKWLNVVNAPTSIEEAFTGFSLIADGFANGDPGTTIEMEFVPGDLQNAAGFDLVVFDSRFSDNAYALSTDWDGFALELELPAAAFAFTGETRNYYYDGGGPYPGSVYAAPVDLTDLGVPAGQVVTRVRLIARTEEVDPLGIGSLYTGGPVGQNYCGPAALNSTGLSAVISGFGSDQVASNSLVLTAAQLPPNQFGYFLVADAQGFVPFAGGSQGHLCLAGNIGRWVKEVASSGPNGELELEVDLTALPTFPPVAVQPGETWNFQAWFRDLNPGPTSNFTDGLSVAFQ